MGKPGVDGANTEDECARMSELVEDSHTANYDYVKRLPLQKVLDGYAAAAPTTATCLALVEAALTLLAEAYVHLPLKRAVYAVNPEARLRLLRARLDRAMPGTRADALAFDAEMLEIFASLYDRHTRYQTGAGLAEWDAILPFAVEAYRDEEAGRDRYVVTSVDPAESNHAGLLKAEVTHWNGVRLGRVLEQLGDQTCGANDAARAARALALLTCRPLITLPPPEEDWVVITARPEATGEPVDFRFTWSAGLVPPEQRALNALAAAAQKGRVGLDSDGHRVAQGKRARATRRVKTLAALKPYAGHAYAKPVTVDGTDYGYVRLHEFLDDDEGRFVDAVAESLEQLPPAGVIVDIRGNPGGDVVVSERLLQLFAGEPLDRQPMQLRNTRLALSLTGTDAFVRWEETVRQGMDAGGGYSAGYPWAGDGFDAPAQAYKGPAVLIVDGLTYSAGDMFAAGWQDNGVGPIVGTAARTGAGGATRLTYNELRSLLGTRPPRLPDFGLADRFTVAICRTSRVGAKTGVLVEDFGVEPDLRPLTRRDLLERNADLLSYAVNAMHDWADGSRPGGREPLGSVA